MYRSALSAFALLAFAVPTASLCSDGGLYRSTCYAFERCTCKRSACIAAQANCRHFGRSTICRSFCRISRAIYRRVEAVAGGALFSLRAIRRNRQPRPAPAIRQSSPAIIPRAAASLPITGLIWTPSAMTRAFIARKTRASTDRHRANIPFRTCIFSCQRSASG